MMYNKFKNLDVVKLNIYKIGVVIGALLFTIVYLGVLKNSIEHNIGLLISIPLLLMCVFLFRKIVSFEMVKKYFKFAFIGMVLVQLACGYLLALTQFPTDSGVVFTSSIQLALTGDLNSSQYFAQYPNNIFLLLFLALCYNIVYVFTGSTTFYFATIMNIILVNSTILITMQIANYLGGEHMKYRTGVLCILFAPLYLYLPFFYTDLLCLPFMMASILVFFKLKEKLVNDKCVSKQTFLLGCLWVFLLFIAIQAKATAAVILIACLIHILLTISLKRVIFILGVLFVGLLCFNLLWGGVVDVTTGITDDDYNRYEFPITHWIMMGLNKEGGGTSAEDIRFTGSYLSYDEKKDATIGEIAVRLSEMGVLGVLEQYFEKAIYRGWSEGTFIAETYLGHYGGSAPLRENILHEFILSSGEYHSTFELYTQGYYLLIFFAALSSFFYGIVNSFKKLEIYYLQVALLGGLLLFMIWEAKPRYILQFTMILILLASCRPCEINVTNSRYSSPLSLIQKVRDILYSLRHHVKNLLNNKRCLIRIIDDVTLKYLNLEFTKLWHVDKLSPSIYSNKFFPIRYQSYSSWMFIIRKRNHMKSIFQKEE